MCGRHLQSVRGYRRDYASFSYGHGIVPTFKLQDDRPCEHGSNQPNKWPGGTSDISPDIAVVVGGHL